jgi:hypothetical protein
VFFASRVSKHRAVLALGLVLVLPIGAAHAAGGIGDLYITSDASDVVRAYTGNTGAFIGNHVATVGASGQMAIHFGTNVDRFLVGHLAGGVEEFTGAGAYIKTYNPGGGWQWAGIYAPNGNVYIGDMSTNDIREYDSTTGAFVQVLCPLYGPADMKIGPNGNLYICSYLGGFVQEVNASNGAPINQWFLPLGASSRCNDIAFLPNGEILVTSMGDNMMHRYSPSLTWLGSYAGTLWQRPHGIDISPWDGNIYVVDGVTTQVHVFDPVTFAELNPAWRSPDPDDKIVDLEFRPDSNPTPVMPTTWSRVKDVFRR